MRKIQKSRFAVVVLFAICCAPLACGVIFYSTADTSYNTSAPTGSLAGSGWQWVGNWGGYEGTPIGPHHFLTAQHVGGTVGNPFVFSGTTYTTTAFFDDTSTDLRICEISGTFPTWAPIYRSSGEVGQGLVVIGAGDTRGTEVQLDGEIKGWTWANDSGTPRWGQNSINSVVNVGGWGSLLYSLFQAGLGPDEADLAYGDSSSPVFINVGTGWTLAGIAVAVDGPFNTTNTGSGFNAAIFDASGLYMMNDNGVWVQIPNVGEEVPTGFYSTRVSARAAWIDSIMTAGGSSDTPLFSGVQTAILLTAIAAFGIYGACRLAPERDNR